ncbi:hypothetical protein D060_05556 [Streptococcus pneumoniae 845]|nr:hypothetical protein C944_09368 [Streptococcus pneumoniae 357]EOB33531.1 hypothetical protein D060_05556 [Streptococcus pneumoniae 845]
MTQGKIIKVSGPLVIASGMQELIFKIFAV